MNTERAIAYLINGGLINILTAGNGPATKAWIIPDSFREFRTIYDNNPTGKGIGGETIPSDALDEHGIFEAKRDEVEKYLMTLGLTKPQAQQVITQAHEWRQPSST
jgi:hypothetical protein